MPLPIEPAAERLGDQLNQDIHSGQQVKHLDVSALMFGYSAAISLKRIADSLEAIVTANREGKTGIQVFGEPR